MIRTQQYTDFTIAGGGLVGSLLALLLAERSYSVKLIEHKKVLPPQAKAPLDTRTLALNYGTVELLKTWNLADVLDKARFLSKIHVSDQGKRGIVHIEASTENLPYLGALVPFEALVFALQQKVLKQSNIEFIEGCLTDLAQDTKILIGADGTDSVVRKLLQIPVTEYDYAAFAAIGTVKVKTNQQMNDYAYERFTPEGPIALLPQHDNIYTLVWVRQNPLPPDFLAALQRAFGYRAGIFTDHGIIKTYPLKKCIAQTCFQGHVGLIGNAAHTLHPVAGQGFNLAVRDILTFIEVLDMQKTLDASLWTEYAKRSQAQQKKIEWMTHSLVKGFQSRNPLITLSRNVLLSGFEHNSFARSELNNMMIGKY